MDINAFTNYLENTPLVWLIVTIGTYKLGLYIYNKSGKKSYLQPIVLAYLILVPILLITQVPYEKYFKSVELLNFFLGPATVALALPLYKNFYYIRKYMIPILVTLFVGATFTILFAVFILYLFDSSIITILSMTTKSVTAPITIITSKDIGGNPALAMSFVVGTGFIGAIFSSFIFKVMKIKHAEAKGFSLGLISHAMGVARAAETSEKTAAFAALAMGLCGIFTAIILPIVISFL